MLTLAILAGGKSRRMGQDKSMIPFQGEALIRRVIDRLAGLDAEVVLIAPKTKEYIPLNVRIEPDIFPGRGSLGGLYTALYCASHQVVAAIACDMPFVNPDLLLHQCVILETNNMDVVVPASEKGLEPLHAVYRRDICLPAVKESLEAGEQRLISWYPRVKVYTMAPSETRKFDPRGLSFLNVNTPQELALAEQMASWKTLD